MADSHGDTYSLRPRLASLPPEIIELIAFHCGSGPSSHFVASTSALADQESYATPPYALRNLVLTSRRMYTLLDSSCNPQLYARIFQSKFDVEAIRRRFGPAATNAKNLTRELQKRSVCLTRMRRAVSMARLFPDGDSEQSRGEMLEILWLCYMMMMENDGRNILQLRWARLEAYLLLHHQQEMLTAAFRPEYPQDSPDRALAFHLNYLISDPDKLETENRDESDEKLFVLRPFVFAAHRFDVFFAPWTARSLPLLSDDSMVEDQMEGENPFIADTRLRDRRQLIQHCGQQIEICCPNSTQAACSLFFMKVERDPAVTGLPDMMDLSEAMAGRRRSGINPGELIPATDPLSFVSLDHDRDVQRLLACASPHQSLGLKTFAHLGALEGSWEGRFCYFDFDNYRSMLGGKLRSLYEGHFGEQPQVWKIKEHVIKLGNSETRGGTGPILNAGYLNENDEPTDRQSLSLSEARTRASAIRQLPHDYHLYPSFDDIRTSTSHDEEDGYEILLSGSGHSAWGQFLMRGRVRSWDGMVLMTKEYRSDGRGRWLYRGYIVAGGRMVGRWRDTFTPEDMSGYEGCFLLHRREE